MKSSFSVCQDTLRELGEERAANNLDFFTRSTQVKLHSETLRLQLSGASLAHHLADPHLDYAAPRALPIAQGDLGGFHTRIGECDICLEDSWTGYFVSRWICQYDAHDPLVFIHLDDHTDMMSTLLTLADCEKDSVLFDPYNADDWVEAIHRGVIGIGSFVTALFYLEQPVYVLHLNHVKKSRYGYFPVFPRSITHPLLPHERFLSIHKRQRLAEHCLGSYRGGPDPQVLLREIPEGRVVVHIDLDYFINDYNGNIGEQIDIADQCLRNNAISLMDDFFLELHNKDVVVERWIVATSPGFCSARHWRWLIDCINQRISKFM